MVEHIAMLTNEGLSEIEHTLMDVACSHKMVK
jgi:hypothetical protein